MQCALYLKTGYVPGRDPAHDPRAMPNLLEKSIKMVCLSNFRRLRRGRSGRGGQMGISPCHMVLLHLLGSTVNGRIHPFCHSVIKLSGNRPGGISGGQGAPPTRAGPHLVGSPVLPVATPLPQVSLLPSTFSFVVRAQSIGRGRVSGEGADRRLHSFKINSSDKWRLPPRPASKFC